MKTHVFETIWEIGDLPFIWNVLDKPSFDNIPSRFPFILGSNLSVGTLVQIPNSRLEAILEYAYNQGSKVAGMMEEEVVGNHYAVDFLDFINNIFSHNEISGKKILDIGCGSGYLLNLLKELGANVTGVEPGSIGDSGSMKYNIPIIKSFFSPKLFKEKFDIIIFTSVLEHFKDPISFLNDCKSILNENGYIFLSVPNCEPYLEFGDISILLHEHFNYFTNQSLNNTLSCSGFDGQICQSTYGNSLYASVQRTEAEKKDSIKFQNALNQCLYLNNKFIKTADDFLKNVSNYFKKFIEKHESVGIYVPSRLINVLALMKNDLTNVRFFDDDGFLHKTYLPSFDITIENKDQLFADPPNHILIASISFGEKIKNNIKTLEDEGTSITLLSDLL